MGQPPTAGYSKISAEEKLPFENVETSHEFCKMGFCSSLFSQA